MDRKHLGKIIDDGKGFNRSGSISADSRPRIFVCSSIRSMKLGRFGMAKAAPSAGANDYVQPNISLARSAVVCFRNVIDRIEIPRPGERFRLETLTALETGYPTKN